jgi:hypothetical protein
MSELSQYAILFGLTVGVFGFVLSLYGLLWLPPVMQEVFFL